MWRVGCKRDDPCAKFGAGITWWACLGWRYRCKSQCVLRKKSEVGQAGVGARRCRAVRPLPESWRKSRAFPPKLLLKHFRDSALIYDRIDRRYRRYHRYCPSCLRYTSTSWFRIFDKLLAEPTWPRKHARGASKNKHFAESPRPVSHHFGTTRTKHSCSAIFNTSCDVLCTCVLRKECRGTSEQAGETIWLNLSTALHLIRGWKQSFDALAARATELACS